MGFFNAKGENSMAEENQEGLDTSSNEQSLYSGDLETEITEQPEGNGSKSSEQPITEGAGESVSESQDSELGNLYADLEKDIPETLKPHAINVKKKFQSYFTKKNQEISSEINALKQNQISDELRSSYTTMYDWYDRIQKDPVSGIRDLASQLGVQPKAIISALQGQPEEEEITPEFLASEHATRADFAKYARQESLKAEKRLREEFGPLKENVSTLTGRTTTEDNEKHGRAAIQEAARTLPGFVDDKGLITPVGNDALNAVLRGEFTGPDAIKKAHYYLMGQQAPNRVKQLESELINLKQNVRGASGNLGGQSPKTTMKPSSPETFWDDMKSEPLS